MILIWFDSSMSAVYSNSEESRKIFRSLLKKGIRQARGITVNDKPKGAR